MGPGAELVFRHSHPFLQDIVVCDIFISMPITFEVLLFLYDLKISGLVRGLHCYYFYVSLLSCRLKCFNVFHCNI